MVMDTVLETFFDAPSLSQYVGDKAEQLKSSDYLQSKIRAILESEEVDAILTKHLDILFTKQEGMMLMMVGMTSQSLKPMVKPFLVQMDAEIAPAMAGKFDPKSMIDAHKIREQVQELMRTKMEMLTPRMVKTLVEDMIRKHLGWLVVWGNILGGFIGLLCQIGSSYS